MALVPDQKFSTFADGGDVAVGDIIVGLRSGVNTRFNYTGELPIGVVVPISQGGTGANNATDARTNLGLGTMAVQNANNVLITGGSWQGGIIDIAYGGTGVGSVTISPTASSWAGWDASSNMSAVNFLAGFATTVSAAGTTILTVGSAYTQEITGSTTQTVQMPVTSTLMTGHSFKIINNSSGSVSLTSSGSDPILVMAANTTAFITCVLNSGTTAASWNASYVFDNGAGVLSITGTANQVIASASTGAVTLSLPQDIATTSVPSFANVIQGYTTTATAAGTTTLTATSNRQQYFTGATTQTVQMPVTSTLSLGQSWVIVNLSSGIVTINSSGGNAITTLNANSQATVTCILTSGTSAASWSFTTTAASGLSQVVVQTFTASGTYTPTTGMAYCIIEVIGGGGAGGGTPTSGAGAGTAAPGGGSGGYGMGRFTAAQIGASQSVTIGAGGAGVANGAGGNGAATSVGALISANGGGGGQATTSTTAVVSNLGGVAATAGSGGSVNAPGSVGGNTFVNGGTITISGTGASTRLGGGGRSRSAVVSNTGGIAATANTGSGGSGAVIQGVAGVAAAGGAGGSGIVIITEYIAV